MMATTKKLPVLGALALGLTSLLGLASPAAAEDSGRQSFVIVAGDLGAGSGRLVATGPIQGRGTDTVTAHVANADGTFTDTDRFDLPDGQVELTDTYTVEITFDPESCRYGFDVNGTWTISGATGRYAGATGNGTFTAHGLIVAGRDEAGECLALDAPSGPVAYTEVAHGTGTATLP